MTPLIARLVVVADVVVAVRAFRPAVKVVEAVQTFPVVRLIDATTDPVVGLIDKVLSLFDTDDTAPDPDPQAVPVPDTTPAVI